MKNQLLWFPFVMAAFTVLSVRLWSFMLKQSSSGSLWVNLVGYFFPDPETAAVTVLNFLFVWLIGSIEIQKLAIPYMEWLGHLPDRAVVAACLGGFGEFAGPTIIKALLRGAVSLIEYFTKGGRGKDDN